MPKYLLCLIISYLWAIHLFTQNVEFISKPDGILVDIHNISSQQSNLNEQQSIELRYPIAVPSDFIPKFEILNCSKTALDKVNEQVIRQKIKKIIRNNNISIEMTGKVRGVNTALLMINPFEYDTARKIISIYNELKLFISFPTKIELMKFNSTKPSAALYSFIYNKEHLTELIEKASQEKVVNYKNLQNNKKPRLLSKSDWYDPAKKYIKVSTTRDGISVIKLSDVLKMAPEWNGKSNQYLHLLYRGEDYPYYIDDKTALNEYDSLVFFGKRAAGDTTWFANYTSNEPFFLVYDETSNSRHLQKPDIPTPVDFLDKVYINEHIEYDKTYHEGIGFPETETTKNEGWYWDKLTQSKINTFNTNIFLVPTLSDNDSIDVTLKVNLVDSTERGNPQIPDYKLHYMVNSDTITKWEGNLVSLKEFSFKGADNSFFPGLNNINFISYPLGKRLGTSLIDFITLKGTVKPHAFQGKFKFHADVSDISVSINIPGFLSDKVIAVDEVNNYIFYPPSQSINNYIVSSEAGSNPYTSFIHNNNYYNSIKDGWHIAYQAGYNFQTRYYTTSSQQVRDLIDSLDIGSVVLISYNGSEDLSSDIINYFISLGSLRIGNFASGQVWAAYFIKGNSISTEEINTRINLEYASVSSDNLNYSASLNLEKNKEYSIMINDNTQFEYSKISPVNSSNLINKSSEADAVIISYKDFIPAAERLAKHRKDRQGLDCKVIDIEDIYKEYNYGRKDPDAIKDFLKYAVNDWKKKPVYVLLVGDASWDARNVMPASVYKDYISSWGLPVSDNWFTLLDDDYIRDILIGRLPVRSLEQAQGVVDKLIEYDTVRAQPWMKKFLSLTGGTNASENEEFYLDSFGWLYPYLNSNLCIDTATIRKRDYSTVGETDARRIREEINDGAFWVTFLGHGSPNIIDMDGWDAQTLNNRGKYPVLSTLSCNTAAFAEPNTLPKNELHVIEMGKGFIGSMGSSGVGQVDIDLAVMQLMSFRIVTRNFRLLGEIQQAGLSSLNPKSIFEMLTIMQYTLLGDPMTRLRIDTMPNLYLHKSDVSIISDKASDIITENDSLAIIRGKIYNNGQFQNKSFNITLTRFYHNDTISRTKIFPELCLQDSFEFQVPVYKMPGEHKVIVIIDPENILIDADRANNKIEFTFYIYSEGLLPLDPLAFWNINPVSPSFRFIQPISKEKKYTYHFILNDKKDTSSVIISDAGIDNLIINESHIIWNPPSNMAKLEPDKPYWIGTKTSKDDGSAGAWQWIPFHTFAIADTLTLWDLNSPSHLRENKNTNLDMLYENDTNKVRLSQKLINYKILTAGGTDGLPVLDSQATIITFNHDSDVSVRVDQAQGFHIITVSPYDFSQKKWKWFITYLHDSIPRNLYYYLRDSIASEDYVLIATNGTAFRKSLQFPKTDPGSIDSLRDILHEYGSVLIDSVQFPNTTFAMLGYRGSKSGTINEKIDNTGDTVIIDSNITLYSTKGEFRTQKIGPAKKWNNIRLTGNYNLPGSKITCIIKGIDRISNAEVFLDTLINPDIIDISGINAFDYPYIDLDLLFEIENKNKEQYLSSIQCEFDPTPETYFSKTASFLKPDTVMRGDKIYSELKINNISKRSRVDSLLLDNSIVDESGTVKSDNILPIRNLQPDSVAYTTSYLITDELSSGNILKSIANIPESFKELYTFNNSNSLPFYIYDDTTKPIIKIYFDDRQINEYDYVRMKPYVRVELWDNSILRIEDPMKFRVRLNGKYLSETNMKAYNFEPVNDETFDEFNKGYLKAVITFIPDTLYTVKESGDPQSISNHILIPASDATGNRDTLKMYFNVDKQPGIYEVVNYPNPFENDLHIKFNYRATDNSGNARLDIYNVIGMKVNSLTLPLIVGENIFHYNARDNNGNSIPPGPYYYFIYTSDGPTIEPIAGRFMYAGR